MWIHAVSLGEVNAAGALINELRGRFPNVRIVVTTSTTTGHDAATQLLAPEDQVLYPPCDLAFVCRRFLRRINPDAVVVLETELWPNFFRECKRYGAALILANGRISEKAFARYSATRFLWRHVLAEPDRLFMQSLTDAERFKSLGAPGENLQVLGNLKFASRPAGTPIIGTLHERFRNSDDSSIIVAGSTMPGEEKYLLEALLQLLPEFPRLWMILAPRHPNRFREVIEEVKAFGVPSQLRSQYDGQGAPTVPGVMILDSMGELSAAYELATVAYVGGTLVPTGGHNILEPAYFSRAIIVGPSMNNFQEIAEEFLQDSGLDRSGLPANIRVGAIMQVPDAASLSTALRFLLLNSTFRRQIGEAAHERYLNRLRRDTPVSPIVDELQRLLALPAARDDQAATQRQAVSAGKVE